MLRLPTRFRRIPSIAAGLAAACVSVTVQAAVIAPLSGSVRDTVGNVLSGVEVLVVETRGATAPLVTTHSNLEGQFRVPGLVPGLYRIAALKEGYVTFVGQVNTVLRSSVDLVLRPAADGPPDGQVPSDSTWVLRVPRRGVFRETEFGYDDGSEIARGRGSAAAQMQVDQLFSVSARETGGREHEADLQATETRLQLASSVSERMNLRVAGRHERVGSSGSADPGARARQRASSMNVEMSYATGTDAQVDLTAFYNQADYELTSEFVGPGLEQRHTTWGYGAHWSKRLDPDSSVAVKIDYQDTALDPLDAVAAPGLPVARRSSIASHAVRAHARYDRVERAGHEIQVALTASMLDWPTEATATPETPGVESVDLAEWNVQLEAQDSWAITDPFRLVYGVGYINDGRFGGSHVVVPRIGTAWIAGDWLVSAIVSYHASGEPPAGDADAVGYEAEFRLPLAQRVSLRGSATYAPVRFDDTGYSSPGDPSRTPLYLTDGNTAVREQRLALVTDGEIARTYVELSRGSATGTLAAMLPFAATIHSVSRGGLSFRNGRVGIYIPGHGTDLLLGYERVTAAAARHLAEGAVQESVELRLRQALARLRAPGDWRLLVALRMGSVDNGGLTEWQAQGGDRTTLEALNRRLSAGVSVVF